MYNIYYDPEKFGLTTVAEVDLAGAYSFDLFVIWRDAAGEYRYATDSGCSCPLPFSGTGVGDLAVADPARLHEALDIWHAETHYVSDQDSKIAEMHDTIAELR